MLLLLTLNIFHAFFTVSIVDFEQLNVCLVRVVRLVIFFGKLGFVCNFCRDFISFCSNKRTPGISVANERPSQALREHLILSVIRQNVRTCAYQGVRNVRFSDNLMCFVFLKHPF